MIDARIVDPSRPLYDLARELNITPARARALLFNWQLRSAEYSGDLDEALRQALQRTRFSKDGTLLTFGIESPLLKEEVLARLKRNGVFADASFARDLVRMPVGAFVDFLDTLVPDKAKKAFVAKLVEDELIADRSFKAVALGVLGKLGEKVAGEAGDAFAKDVVGAATDSLGSLLGSLFRGNGKQAGSVVIQALGAASGAVGKKP